MTNRIRGQLSRGREERKRDPRYRSAERAAVCIYTCAFAYIRLCGWFLRDVEENNRGRESDFWRLVFASSLYVELSENCGEKS